MLGWFPGWILGWTHSRTRTPAPGCASGHTHGYTLTQSLDWTCSWTPIHSLIPSWTCDGILGQTRDWIRPPLCGHAHHRALDITPGWTHGRIPDQTLNQIQSALVAQCWWIGVGHLPRPCWPHAVSGLGEWSHIQAWLPLVSERIHFSICSCGVVEKNGA